MEVAADYDGSLPLVEYQPRSRNHRHQLFSGWGIAFLTIAYRTYRRAEDLNGPVGFLVEKVGSLASPVAYTMLHQWLTILSFADDQILAIEDVAECLFPPSAFVFYKIHMFADISEAIPEKLDYIIDHFPMLVANRLPFFNWARTHVSMGLDFLIYSLMEWDTSCGKEERGLIMDSSCPDHSCEPPVENPKGANHFERQQTIEKMTIISEPQQPKTKMGPTEKHFSDDHDHIKKQFIFRDDKDAKRKSWVTKALQAADHHRIEKPLIFRDGRHVNTNIIMTRKTAIHELDPIEKSTILDDVKHARKDTGMTKKSHDNGNKKPVESVYKELLPAAEKIAKKESENGKLPALKAPQKAGKSSTDHKEANPKDDLILDLFDSGWHSKRSGRSS
ncbi:hypothetical protein ACLOJK_009088 [Asimina triloba]